MTGNRAPIAGGLTGKTHRPSRIWMTRGAESRESGWHGVYQELALQALAITMGAAHTGAPWSS